jgi:glycosyltransferase involved in cell wall biosynthesis
VNIVHVCKVWFPRVTGVTVHVDHLARNMARAGHRVSVVTYDLDGDSTRDNPVREEAGDGYAILRVRPGCALRFREVVERAAPDAVHAHGIWEHVWPSFRAARRVGARFFLTAHGTWQFLYATPGMADPLRRLRFRLHYHLGWRWMVRNAHAMIALNAIEEAAHRRLGARRVVRIPNGVDCREFAPHRRTDAETESSLSAPHLLFAGSVQTQKGIFVLLDALERLDRTGGAPTLRVAGDGPELAAARQRVADRNLPVHFLGRVGRDRMPALMAGAALFVLPSENEPFATVYLEAMASGTPCAGTSTGGTPEIIRPGATGFLISPGDDERLADTLRAALARPADLARMGRKARLNTLVRFDWPVLTERLLFAYTEKLP